MGGCGGVHMLDGCRGIGQRWRSLIFRSSPANLSPPSPCASTPSLLPNGPDESVMRKGREGHGQSGEERGERGGELEEGEEGGEGKEEDGWEGIGGVRAIARACQMAHAAVITCSLTGGWRRRIRSHGTSSWQLGPRGCALLIRRRTPHGAPLLCRWHCQPISLRQSRWRSAHSV